MNRDKHLAKQLRAALRASRCSADVIAFRACIGRSTMARVLVGDLELSLRVYELVAEQLEVHLELTPWRAVGTQPVLGRSAETVVDRARVRTKTGTLADIKGIVTLPPGFTPVSIDEMRK